jgi:hypothetical protein
MINNNKPQKSKSWSYVTLFLITGFVGAPIMAAIGYIVTKAIKRPKTGFDDYGWRGVGTGSILFGIYSFLLGIVVIVRGETSSIIGTLIITILFGILPLYIGKKLIIDWT